MLAFPVIKIEQLRALNQDSTPKISGRLFSTVPTTRTPTFSTFPNAFPTATTPQTAIAVTHSKQRIEPFLTETGIAHYRMILCTRPGAETWS